MWRSKKRTDEPRLPTATHIFTIDAQVVPHGGHDFGHLAERGVRILTFDGSLGIAEEQRVGRHGSAKTKTADEDCNTDY